ncbi:ribonuclease III domain-containing protein [Halteromyces radiatus]|uniref:ribonuclease III domain-containing protein n=1 Tax=Halteromyces radiatus TaxID=101107 RepID=UPI00221E50C5|nr:ribonuclease III domain-containing protein [Halteromyces radiatus]KAI8093536.1 ribonuclease III domain-containing protein [Halteromyces radiatus]
MLLSKCRPLVSRIQIPRTASISLFHTNRIIQSATYPSNVSINNNDNNNNNNNNNAALFAFGSRLGLQNLSPQLLQQAVTHATFDAEHNNQALSFLGKQAILYYTTEYLHCKYPDLPVDCFKYATSAYTSAKATNSLGHQLGLQHVMRWERPQTAEDSVMDGHAYAMCSCINALVGAVYQEQGPDAAKKMVHDYILNNRTIDLLPAFRRMEAKRSLSALLNRSKKERAVSRLLSETGRKSSSPVFVVGVFSGNKKLGEGFGSSLKMAEHRACRDALMNHYAQEQKDYILPSDAHLVDSYVPPVLGDTEAIV